MIDRLREPLAVIVHGEGDIRHMHFFDQQGNEIRDLTVFPKFRVTFTNQQTGKSITTVSPSVEHVTVNPDGSAVVTITGLSGHLIVGGGPPQAADVGRIVFFFSGPEDEEPDILFQAGQFSMVRSRSCATCWPTHKPTDEARQGGSWAAPSRERSSPSDDRGQGAAGTRSRFYEHGRDGGTQVVSTPTCEYFVLEQVAVIHRTGTGGRPGGRRAGSRWEGS